MVNHKLPANIKGMLGGIKFAGRFFWVRQLFNGTPQKNSSCESHQPPFNAEHILRFLLAEEEREIIIGDLIEAYDSNLVQLGKRRADIIFYKQIFYSVWPLLRHRVSKVVRLKKLREWLRSLARGANQIGRTDVVPKTIGQSEELLKLNAALEKFAVIDPRASRVVELRFFGGYSQEEVAEMLGISVITVAREWRGAWLWLLREINAACETVRANIDNSKP